MRTEHVTPILIVLTAVMSLSVADEATAVIDERYLADSADHLQRIEKLGFSGVVLVAQRGRPLFARGYGLADREREIPWTPATVSTIGSITKQFTGAAILLLRDEGRLSVTDPITKYFDAVPEDKRTITLHQLLTHSSGIVDLNGADDWDPIGREEFVRRIMAQPLAFAPGARYRYSNAGYSLLGAIVEKLSGGSYEAFVRERLFLPHGLHETGYVLPQWGEGRLAQGYAGGEKWGTVLGRPLDEDGPYWVLRANGGIHTTAYDMLRWATALLEGRVLSPESMELYWTPHVDEGDGEFAYAYGWTVFDVDGVRVITHNGGNGIFMADMAIVPDTGVVLFVQTNTRADSEDAPVLLQRMCLRLLQDAAYPDVPRVMEVDRARLQALTGEYDAAGGALVVAVDGSALTVEPRGSAFFSRFHSTEPAFDAERVTRFNDRIAGIVGAYVAGDFGPLHRAYAGCVSEQFLAERYAERRVRAEQQHGPYLRFEVLGTALRGDERDYTVVRFHHERGHEDRAYVWHGTEAERLLGVSVRGLGAAARFFPVGDDRFASWDAIAATSRKLSVVRGDDGVTLSIDEGASALEGVRRVRAGQRALSRRRWYAGATVARFKAQDNREARRRRSATDGELAVAR